jgi:hypothetical protein
MDSPIRIQHFDLMGDAGANIIQSMTGCDRQAAQEFVVHNHKVKSNSLTGDPFSSHYVPSAPQPHIRLERAEMAAEKGNMKTALSEFEYLYTNHKELCRTHVRKYILLEWTHYTAFCNKKDKEGKDHTIKALSMC